VTTIAMNKPGNFTVISTLVSPSCRAQPVRLFRVRLKPNHAPAAVSLSI
jgi:hypothetical protein